ncbi:hypothetical protein U1Q18_015720 [Sarracenia purpurea var. burkii]
MRQNCVEEDWINQLPNEILITILSQLSFVEAARTCVLSKRWQYLWTYVKALDFEFPKKLMMMRRIMMMEVLKSEPKAAVGEKIPEYVYVGWVNRVIQLHQGPYITDFKVNFRLSHKNSDDIDEWFNFAIGKSVQRLEVNLLGHTTHAYPDYIYTLPDNFCSLIKTPRGLSCIKTLAQLSLKSVNVTGEIVEHFLSYCPLLERLCLSFSTLLVHLKVTGSSLRLKSLEISHCMLLQTVDIYAPNLASLMCVRFAQHSRVVVRHAPSLVDVSIGHSFRFLRDLVAFSSCFTQLESLTLCINLSSDYAAPVRFPKLTNVKNLTFLAHDRQLWSFVYWASVIERFPILHAFKLQMPKNVTLMPDSI